MKKKVVPKLRQEVKVKVDIITSDDIKIYYTGKLQDFTARYIVKSILSNNVLDYDVGWSFDSQKKSKIAKSFGSCQPAQ